MFIQILQEHFGSALFVTVPQKALVLYGLTRLISYALDLNNCATMKVGFLDSAKHLLISSYRDNIEK